MDMDGKLPEPAPRVEEPDPQVAWKEAITAPIGVRVAVKYANGFEATGIRLGDTGGWIVQCDYDMRGFRPEEWTTLAQPATEPA